MRLKLFQLFDFVLTPINLVIQQTFLF